MKAIGFKGVTKIIAAAALSFAVVGVIWHFTHRTGDVTKSLKNEKVQQHYPLMPGIRNVVLISIDTCRADRLSCYGYPRKSTPNIDAIAREAVLFKHAMVSVPMTLPSHCSMMTGAYPPVHGVRTNDGYHLLASNVTLAKTLHDAGYQTAAFVGGFPLDARFGLNQGFDTYDGRFDKEGGEHDRRTAEDVTGRGLAWLEAHSKEPAQKPFFLFLHYYDAHYPYHPPAPFDKTFAEDPYAGGIAYIDSWIGHVVERLRSLGLYDNTLLMIVGDHGESLGEHHEREHSFYVYQSTLHVPLIIRAPGIGQGREAEQTVNLVDLMPTALSILGVAQPKRVQGNDLRDCLEGKPWQGPLPTYYFESLQPAVFNCCPLQGVVDGRWKFIRAPRPELYDLTGDPNELTNLAAKETATVQRLRDKVEDLLDEMRTLAAPGDSSFIDPAASKRLESLGYVGGSVVRPEFDAKSEDPKDFAAIHTLLDEANEFNRTGQLENARKDCLETIEKRPDLVQPYILLGEIASKQRLPAEAVNRLTKALSLFAAGRSKSKALPSAVENNEIAAVHSHRGIALLMEGKSAEAEADFKTALAIDPNSADFQYNLGNLYLLGGRNPEAIARYQKTVDISPEYPEAHKNMAAALLACGRADEAMAAYEKELLVKPGDVRTRVNLADMLAARGKSDAAVVHYRKAIESAPDDVDANNNLGLVLAGLGQIEEAIAQYRKALKINPNYAPAHNNLGLALAGQGHYDEAIAEYEVAIKIKPDYAEAHNNLGVALAAGRGQMDAAIVHFQKALEIRPGYVGALQNLEHARGKQ